jgi:16S rRNA (cytosine967-C5)-methyltransferase
MEPIYLPVSALAKSSSISPARLTAFQILLRVENGAYSSILLATEEEKLSPPDRALAHELVMGTLRRQLWLDRLIEHFSARPSDQLDDAVRIILRLGLYQLRFLTRIPASAAVNESVKLVGVARKRSAEGFVNAVLRRAAREPDVDPANDISDPIERLSVETSHPSWLIERWVSSFGEEQASDLAEANNQPATTAFRVVRNRANENEIIDQLKQAGATVAPSTIAEGAWRITGGGNLFAELVATGVVYVQDEASQLLAYALDVKPTQSVLDLCAAPGSKTTHIADLTSGTATVIASDLHEHRLRTVTASAKLQGLTNIHALTADALRPLPLPEKYFDRVLVDAPCSGTGTLRRNPDIRWRISNADIQDLAARQAQLLNNAAQTVKPGGRLVYSTCSVETDENENVRHLFLNNNKGFKPAKLNLQLKPESEGGTARTWPNREGCDGFFISAFERESQ